MPREFSVENALLGWREEIVRQKRNFPVSHQTHCRDECRTTLCASINPSPSPGTAQPTFLQVELVAEHFHGIQIDISIFLKFFREAEQKKAKSGEFSRRSKSITKIRTGKKRFLLKRARRFHSRNLGARAVPPAFAERLYLAEFGKKRAPPGRGVAHFLIPFLPTPFPRVGG